MHPIENVIWQALSTKQSHLAVSNGCAKKFAEEVSLLGGFSGVDGEGFDSLLKLVSPGEQAGVFLTEPLQSAQGWEVINCVPLMEMVEDDQATMQPESAVSFVELGEKDVSEMMALAKLTKPGPFRARTHEMGSYFGIRERGELVAMAGERLRVPGYTEISAVCTHPKHLGRGFATALMNLLRQQIHQRGERAFLHVRADNRRAVGLYEHLGFSQRVLLYYVVLERPK